MKTTAISIPAILFELGLRADEIALYVAVKACAGKSGICRKSARELAEDAGMSAGSVSRVKRTLILPRPALGGRALLSIEEERNEHGGHPRHILRITNFKSPLPCQTEF